MSLPTAVGCMPATPARSPCRASARESLPRSSANSSTASATRSCTPVVTSITAAWVSGVTRSRNSGPRPAITSSEREASDQSRGSRSMNSSSIPIVKALEVESDCHADQAGRLVIVRGWRPRDLV